MSKMLEIESCWVCPRFKDLTCLLHREVQQPDKKITDNIHPDCPLPDKEDIREFYKKRFESVEKATEKRVVDDVIEIIENYRCHDKTYERVGMIEELRKKYEISDE